MPENVILKRKIIDEMVEWKNTSNGKSALLIEGARRVGKTYAVTEFAKKYYKSYIIVDFSRYEKDIYDLFNNGVDFDFLFNSLSSFYKTELYPRESLIVFDEVQLCPRARSLIKHLVIDGRYDYIETGSLLSIKTNVKDILIPSEEERLEMYPLDFEEFLWALGDNVSVPILKEHFDSLEPLGNAIHKSMMQKFREYLAIGGMPQAVLEYLKTKDFKKVDRIKQNILNLYREDVSKFAGRNRTKVERIFDEICSTLSKKDKKIKLSSLSKDARMRDYDDAFMWLADAKIVLPTYNSTNPTVGLNLYRSFSSLKLYMADTGLLVSQCFNDKKLESNDLYEAILKDQLEINEGILMENVVAQELYSHKNSLFFFSRADNKTHKNEVEIDFLVTDKDNKICPIEVKSSKHLSHVSLDKFREKYHTHLGNSYVLYTKDIMIKNGIIHLPIYMSMFL